MIVHYIYLRECYVNQISRVRVSWSRPAVLVKNRLLALRYVCQIPVPGDTRSETSNYFHAQPQKRPTSPIAAETHSLSTKVDYSDSAFAYLKQVGWH